MTQALRAQLEIGIAHRNRDHRHVWAALGIGLTAEALAIAAILAGAEFRAVRIGVGLRGVRRRPRKWMIASVARGVGEHFARQNRRQRRQGIVAGARCLERIASREDFSGEIAGLAGNRSGVLELLVIRLELGIGDAPILNRHVVGNEFFAVALFVSRANLEFHVGPAPGVAAPVHAGSAHHFAGQERAEPAHRQRVLLRIVAHGNGVARGVLHQVVAHDIAQLVADVGQRIVILAGPQASALERDHLQAGFGQLLGQNAAGPAQPDDDDVDFGEFCGHGAPLSSCPRCRRAWSGTACRDTAPHDRGAPR